MKWTLIYLLIPLINGHYPKNMTTIHQWKQVEFTFPSDIDEKIAIESGRYVRGLAIPVDVDVDTKG
jgi:hypothetical protein